MHTPRPLCRCYEAVWTGSVDGQYGEAGMCGQGQDSMARWCGLVLQTGHLVFLPVSSGPHDLEPSCSLFAQQETPPHGHLFPAGDTEGLGSPSLLGPSAESAVWVLLTETSPTRAHRPGCQPPLLLTQLCHWCPQDPAQQAGWETPEGHVGPGHLKWKHCFEGLEI